MGIQTEMSAPTTPNEEEPEEPGKGGIPGRWIFYSILAYAFFQTFYFWWNTRGE